MPFDDSTPSIAIKKVTGFVLVCVSTADLSAKLTLSREQVVSEVFHQQT